MIVIKTLADITWDKEGSKNQEAGNKSVQSKPNIPYLDTITYSRTTKALPEIIKSFNILYKDYENDIGGACRDEADLLDMFEGWPDKTVNVYHYGNNSCELWGIIIIGRKNES